MNRRQTWGSGLLLLAALIWGLAFVAQSAAMDYVGPFTFTAVRNLIGAAVLLVFLAVRRAVRPEILLQRRRGALWQGGLLCGLVLCVASNLQQIGVAQTTVGKAGFITAMYVVLVPLCGLLRKKRLPARLWFSVGIAVAGLYFLCMDRTFTVSAGDGYVAACAVCFTVHILVIDRFSSEVDGVALSCAQFFVAGVLSLVPALLWEHPNFASLLAAWAPVLYAGVLSSGVAYTLQVVGQTYTPPTLASLLMSLESVFAALGGAVLLRQIPTARELLGCCLMFGAILLSQLTPVRKENAP